jgi:hypothetical protein
MPNVRHFETPPLEHPQRCHCEECMPNVRHFETPPLEHPQRCHCEECMPREVVAVQQDDEDDWDVPNNPIFQPTIRHNPRFWRRLERRREAALAEARRREEEERERSQQQQQQQQQQQPPRRVVCVSREISNQMSNLNMH